MGSRSFLLCLTTGLILFSMNLYGSEATEFWVGGNKEINSWRIPSSLSEFNNWAEKERFRIGDSLVFKYESKMDSVLRVDEEDYKKCNKTNPLRSYHDGNTKIVLDEAGPFFFISGAGGHCEKGEKLEVKVLSPKHGSVGVPPPSQAPKPSPTTVLPRPVLAPANAPSSSPVLTPASAPTASPAASNVVVIGISTLAVMTSLFVVAMV